MDQNGREGEVAENYHAADVQWQGGARCTDAEFEFVPDNETDHGLATARGWCDPCAVRMECLAYALLYHAKGYWGGTSTSERTLLAYTRTRAKCPVCKSVSLVRADGHEICTSCGVSWNRSTTLEGETDDDGRAVGGREDGHDRPGESAPGVGEERVPAC